LFLCECRVLACGGFGDRKWELGQQCKGERGRFATMWLDPKVRPQTYVGGTERRWRWEEEKENKKNPSLKIYKSL
jgi:hypothetical protein